MIKVKSEIPYRFRFISETTEENDFIKLNADEIINNFIDLRSKHKFHSLKDFAKKTANITKPIDIMVFWARNTELLWSENLIQNLEEFVNKQFKQRKAATYI